MARTKRKDHGLFDHPNLPQGPPRRTGELRMISLVRGIWVLALAIITSVIAPGVAMADHTYLPWKIFKFTGSPAAGVQDRHDFTIDQDGALYFTLKSFTPGAEVPGWTPVLEIGFYPKNQSLCPFRYASTTKDPPVVQPSAPITSPRGRTRACILLSEQRRPGMNSKSHTIPS
jgi:hypothetical protein